VPLRVLPVFDEDFISGPRINFLFSPIDFRDITRPKAISSSTICESVWRLFVPIVQAPATRDPIGALLFRLSPIFLLHSPLVPFWPPLLGRPFCIIVRRSFFMSATFFRCVMRPLKKTSFPDARGSLLFRTSTVPRFWVFHIGRAADLD